MRSSSAVSSGRSYAGANGLPVPATDAQAMQQIPTAPQWALGGAV
jgi:hypothetical protein